jgi:integrative and conjugative element protein (TIGR02256 family)
MRYQIGKHNIAFHVGALGILDRFTQRNKNQPEAGGVILGKLIGDEIQIMRLSVPTQLDKASRYSFERHAYSAQIVIDYEFYNSGGEMVYLGEWHTHPEAHPTPSCADKNMIRRQYNNNGRQTDFLLLVIQGTSSRYVGLIENDLLIT